MVTRQQLNPGSTDQTLVVIVGAGISGLLSALLLEKANIEYVVLEREKRPQDGSHHQGYPGCAITVGPAVLRIFDQLRLLDRVLAVARPIQGYTFQEQNEDVVGKVDISFFKKRYGYDQVTLLRSDLIQILLDQVPPHKVHFEKPAQSIFQSVDFSTVCCWDETLFDGDVILGCDGAFSCVRDFLIRNKVFEHEPVDADDQRPHTVDRFALLGVSEPLFQEGQEGEARGGVEGESDRFAVMAKDGATEVKVVLASDQVPYEIWMSTLHGNRIAWYIECPEREPTTLAQPGYTGDDYKMVSAEILADVLCSIKDVACPFGGTMGDLLERQTRRDEIVKVNLEERHFRTQASERTILVGDACHRITPFGGQNVTQAVLDVVSIVDLIKTLPVPHDYRQVGQIFQAQYKRRNSIVAGAMSSTQAFQNLILNAPRTASNISSNLGQGPSTSVGAGVNSKMEWLGSMTRSVVFDYAPPWVYKASFDHLHTVRPQVSFLPVVEDHAEVKAVGFKAGPTLKPLRTPRKERLDEYRVDGKGRRKQRTGSL